MSAYAIFIRERTRVQSDLDAYQAKAGATLAGHSAKVLAAYGRQELLEGAAHEGVVIVEFPTIEAARAWYDGPGYRAARELRFKGADYRAFIVEGL